MHPHWAPLFERHLVTALLPRPVKSGYSYMAANDPRVHIGLGRQAMLEDVTVHWVDGTTTSFGDLSPKSLHRLIQPDADDGSP